MEGASSSSGPQLPESSDDGQLFLASRKVIKEEVEVMVNITFERLIVPMMESLIHKVVKEEIQSAQQMQSDFHLRTTFSDFGNGSLVHGNGMQQQDFIDGTGITLAESEVIPSSTLWRKYRTLFHCLSRWLFIRKMLRSSASPASKKQKIR